MFLARNAAQPLGRRYIAQDSALILVVPQGGGADTEGATLDYQIHAEWDLSTNYKRVAETAGSGPLGDNQTFELNFGDSEQRPTTDYRPKG
jgi:hypothetical protein